MLGLRRYFAVKTGFKPFAARAKPLGGNARSCVITLCQRAFCSRALRQVVLPSRQSRLPWRRTRWAS